MGGVVDLLYRSGLRLLCLPGADLAFIGQVLGSQEVFGADMPSVEDHPIARQKVDE